jgi:uncharacterized integral membrane protein
MPDDLERESTSRSVVRIVAVLVVLGVLIAFVVDNRQSVKVGYVVGDASPPLIWVLVITAVLGVLLDRAIVWYRRRR